MVQYQNYGFDVIAINISGRYSKERLSGGGKRYIELMNQIARQGVGVWWVGKRPVNMALDASITHVANPEELGYTRESTRLVVVFDEAEIPQALRVTRLVGGKVVVFPRGNKLVHNPRGIFGNLIKRLIIMALYRQAHALVFQTNTQAREFEATFRIRTPTYVLPNSLNASWIERRHLKEEDRQLKRVGFIGDRTARKGFDIFATAASHLARFGLEFHCLGFDETANDPPGIKYWGYRNDVKEFLESVDLLVIPSRYDSFPNVLLEAVAGDVPVLVSDTPIFREIVEHHELLFGISAKDLADRLYRLASDKTEYKRVVEKSRDVRNRYSFNWGAEAVRILKEVAQAR